jgi:hypothetical protein
LAARCVKKVGDHRDFKADKFEQAWIRVILEGDSKREIVKATGESDGMVAHMRRVKAAYERTEKFGKELRQKIGALRKSSWSLARAAFLELLKVGGWGPLFGQ